MHYEVGGDSGNLYTFILETDEADILKSAVTEAVLRALRAQVQPSGYERSTLANFLAAVQHLGPDKKNMLRTTVPDVPASLGKLVLNHARILSFDEAKVAGGLAAQLNVLSEIMKKGADMPRPQDIEEIIANIDIPDTPEGLDNM